MFIQFLVYRPFDFDAIIFHFIELFYFILFDECVFSYNDYLSRVESYNFSFKKLEFIQYFQSYASAITTQILL